MINKGTKKNKKKEQEKNIGRNYMNKYIIYINKQMIIDVSNIDTINLFVHQSYFGNLSR